MAEQHITTAEFFGSPVSIIDHAGKRWLTADEAGRCLGYNEANASAGVRNLYNRHADEFTEADSCRINLMRQGQNREVLIFSGAGCRLLGFFASTPQAKRFRAWAAQTLEAVAPIADALPAVAHSPRLEASLQRMAQSVDTLAAGMNTVLTQLDVTRKYIGLLELNQSTKVRVTPAIRGQARQMAAEGMNFADIGRLLRISRTSVSLIVRGIYPDSTVTDTPPATVAGKLDEWIEREQARLTQTLGSLKGGA